MANFLIFCEGGTTKVSPPIEVEPAQGLSPNSFYHCAPVMSLVASLSWCAELQRRAKNNMFEAQKWKKGLLMTD